MERSLEIAWIKILFKLRIEHGKLKIQINPSKAREPCHTK